jgi:redox-sensitive bicupin YhaK (pirin superfamily)
LRPQSIRSIRGNGALPPHDFKNGRIGPILSGMHTTQSTRTASIAASHQATSRSIIYRSRGSTHGPITRLVSPGDLGQVLKPFVFLDLFDNGGRPFPAIGMHPHSGIATLTYVSEGSVSYRDTDGASGVLHAGGIEWMQAGKGAWHSGGPGEPGRTRGFQLWVALPPELELGSPVSIYKAAAQIQQAGPARVLLGEYQGAQSPIAAPSSINYLAVNLRAGQRWRHEPPQGHSILWLAMSKGRVRAPMSIDNGEIVVFEYSEQGVEFVAEEDSEFVIGSAVPHPHDLVMGYYSVHTSQRALDAGESHIQRLREELIASGRL